MRSFRINWPRRLFDAFRRRRLVKWTMLIKHWCPMLSGSFILYNRRLAETILNYVKENTLVCSFCGLCLNQDTANTLCLKKNVKNNDCNT